MKWLYFLIIVFTIVYADTCDRFLTQHCIDIPFGFRSISQMKCLQLIPADFDVSIVYSVKNYIIKKTSNCYDIVSYESPSNVLFSSRCEELCPREYCKLLSNQPNTSIINIFYSESSTYEVTNQAVDLSYDYFLFDSCSSDNRQNVILRIVVYTLAGVIGVLTIIVVTGCIVGSILKDKDIFSWRWIRDLFLCRLWRKKKQGEEDFHTFNDNSIPINNKNESNVFTDLSTISKTATPPIRSRQKQKAEPPVEDGKKSAPSNFTRNLPPVHSAISQDILDGKISSISIHC
ncbi:unnamed protein product [Adineta ricciae]|uniref:Uncharacterized protein n=1 Tax=Adineta ricciae TaxID=249248 RepID=A0A815GMQ3_ADIRI|nr:unnamed protein product [Adineta ricciae]